MLLIRSADVYAPEHIGVRDLLIAQGAILAMEKHIDLRCSALKAEEIDASGLIACPGLVDQHLHAIGGGGEAGPYSRTPEVQLSTVVSSGVTTVIGVLGTDGMEEGIVDRESLRAAIGSLPDRERQVILLRYYRGMTQEQTARVLGVSQVQVSRNRSIRPSQ